MGFKDRYWVKTLKWHLYKRRSAKPAWRSQYLLERAARRLTPQDIVIDCGANVGAVTALLAARGALVHAFEPDPYAFARLSERAPKNVVLHNVAVGDREDVVRLFRSPTFNDNPDLKSQSSSIFAGKINVSSESAIDVRQIDLASFIEGLPGRIAILKMDIEGAEVPVLEKLIATRVVDKIDLIFAETHETKIPELYDRTMRLKDTVRTAFDGRINLDWV